MIKRAIEWIYDPDLLPLNKENTANYITLGGVWLSRLSLYLFFFLLFYYLLVEGLISWLRYIAIGLAIVAAIMDAVDGYVARKFKCVSTFGQIFDPHHDKIQYLCKTSSLVLDAFLFYLVTGEALYIVFAILVKYFTGERDETVSFHRLWAITVSPEIKVSARQSGKWRTRICFTAFPLLHLLIEPIRSKPVFALVSIVLVVATCVSLYDYVRGYRQAIKDWLRS